MAETKEERKARRAREKQIIKNWKEEEKLQKERAKALDAREQDLNAKEQILRTRKDEFGLKEQELYEKEQALQTKEQDLNVKEHNLGVKEQDLGLKQIALLDKEQELQAEEQVLLDKEQELQAEEQELQKDKESWSRERREALDPDNPDNLDNPLAPVQADEAMIDTFVLSTESTFETANTYVSVSEADIHLRNELEWTSLDESEKIDKIIHAVTYIDSYNNFIGEKTSKTQVLEFPRNGNLKVPYAIKQATLAVLKQIITEPESLHKNIIKEKIGDLEVTYGDGGSFFQSSGVFFNNDVKLLLSKYVSNTVQLANEY